MIYRIIVREPLVEIWSDWFNGMTITREKDANGATVTVLTGAVVDQPALHGILNKIRDLNLTLLAVNRDLSESDTQHITNT
ncbi:MAG: hypothetical protein M1546_26425 [Chloroflexi bacterium]|nr:hypothetical protein [Chloroflexota bacterium]